MDIALHSWWNSGLALEPGGLSGPHFVRGSALGGCVISLEKLFPMAQSWFSLDRFKFLL